MNQHLLSLSWLARVESVRKGTAKNPVRPQTCMAIHPRSEERGILAFSRNGKVKELFQKGIIVDEFAAYAPAEGSSKGNRVGGNSMRA